jgi:hypothetical protein
MNYFINKNDKLLNKDDLKALKFRVNIVLRIRFL